MDTPSTDLRTCSIRTYEDYCALPDDGNRYEVIEGELHVSPSPRWSHQFVQDAIHAALRQHVLHTRFGWAIQAPMDVVLSPGNYVEPDIIVIAREDTPAPDAPVEKPPQLCVEIVSPETRERDFTVKKRAYERHGIPHYWIVDPQARTLDEFVLRKGKYEHNLHVEGDASFTSALFPELTMDLGAIWNSEGLAG